MLYDHRTYTCRPGTIRKALELYAEHGFKAQSGTSVSPCFTR